MQRTLSTRLSIWIAALMAALGLALAPQLAHAHDVMVDSAPEVGSTVETSPAEVRLQFSAAPLSGEGLTNLIQVTDAQGNQWQDGDVAVEGYELAIPLCEGLPQGEYTVDYRVVYSDGHTGEESFSFTNADPQAPTEGAPQDCGEATTASTSTESTSSEPAAADTDETQAADNAEETVENESSSIPAWVWISAIAGIVVVVVIIVMIMRGSRVGETSDAEDDQ